ncbi:MAG: hypothetical protein ABIS38_09555 [Sphingomicrobium sp.]
MLFWISGIFGWNAWRGVNTGQARVPIGLFGLDEYDRDHTLFWGVIGLDVLLWLMALAASAYLASLSFK